MDCRDRRGIIRNIDKYKDELILDAMANSIAVYKEAKKIVPCNDLACIDCLFYEPGTNCIEARLEWLQAEYEEPKVDWSNVAVDTPIYVRNIEGNDWMPGHFAKYEGGKVYTWRYGRTSHTEKDKKYCDWWLCAKLAEVEHEDD